MGTDIDRLEIQIEAQASKANAQLDKLASRLNNVASSLMNINTIQGANSATTGGKVGQSLKAQSQSAYHATKSFKGLSSVIGTLYMKFFLLARAISGVSKAIKTSMNYVETFNYFNVTMSKLGADFSDSFAEFGYDSAEAYAESFQNRLTDLLTKMTGYEVGSNGELLNTGSIGLGLDPEQLMRFEAKISAVTNSVGLLGENSVQATKALSMLSADISSLTNTDFDTVMTNLSSGLIGQSRALYKYGVDITNNTFQAYADAIGGVDKAVSEMTQAEKMQLRLLAILDQTQVAWGDQANTINSVANQYRVFNQQTANLGRTFGNIFLPAVQNVLPYINGLVIATNRLLTTFGFNIWGDSWLTDLNDGISGGVAEDVDGLDDSLEDANKTASKLKQNLLGFDELTVLNDNSSNMDSSGVVDYTTEIADALSEYEEVWNKAMEDSENKAEELAVGIETNMKKIASAFYNFDEKKLTAISEAIKGIAVGLATYWTVNGIATGVKNLVGMFKGIAKHPYAAIASALTAISVISWDALSTFLKEKMSTEGVDGAAESLSELAAAMDELKEAGMEDIGGIEENEQVAKKMLEDYFKLLNDGSVSWTEKSKELEGYAKTITELFPGLKTLIDEHTGLFTANKDEIEANIEALSQYAKQVASQDLLSDAYSIKYKAEVDKSKLATEYSKLQKEVAEKYGWEAVFNPRPSIFNKTLNDYFNMHTKMVEYNAIIDDTNKEIEILQGMISGTGGTYETFNESIADANKELDDNKIKIGETKEETDAYVKTLVDATKSINSFRDGFFSLDGMKANMELSVTIPKGADGMNGLLNFQPIQIPQYETGGYPEDGLFFANHNEIIGKFQNGKTAVANNKQIEDGISSAVYNANQETNYLLKELIAAVKSGSSIIIDGKEVFKSVRNNANEYFSKTGSSAFQG